MEQNGRKITPWDLLRRSNPKLLPACAGLIPAGFAVWARAGDVPAKNWGHRIKFRSHLIQIIGNGGYTRLKGLSAADQHPIRSPRIDTVAKEIIRGGRDAAILGPNPIFMTPDRNIVIAARRRCQPREIEPEAAPL